MSDDGFKIAFPGFSPLGRFSSIRVRTADGFDPSAL